VPQQIELAHAGLSNAQFSPDGRYVLTSAPRSLKLWTVGKDGPSWEYSARATDSRDWSVGYTTVEFSPDSSSVVAISKNQVAEVLSVSTGKLLLREQKVHEAAFTEGGRSFFAASDLGWVRWRAILPDDPWKLPAMPQLSLGDRVMALTFSPDGKQAVIAREKQGAQFVDASTWELDGKPLPHDWSLKGAAFSPDGRTLVTTSYLSRFGFGPTPDKVQIWDVATRQPIGEPIEHPATRPVFDVTGQTVHLGGSLLDLKTRNFIPLPAYDRSAKSHPVASLFHWINRGWPLLPELRDAETGELKRLQMPQVSENGAVLTHDGRGLITAHRDGTSRLWDAQTGQPLGPAFRPEGSAEARTPDGRFVVYGNLTTTRIWDPFAGRPCGEPLRNESANIYASFNPAGDKLATVWHFTANLWDSATGQALGPPMMQRSNGCDDVLFSPDGKLLIVLCQGVQRYRVPLPAADEPERLLLSVEVRTGLTVTENGTLQKLSQPEWLDRARRLQELGGPCDVQPAAP
jgi:WD40 repeat protein